MVIYFWERFRSLHDLAELYHEQGKYKHAETLITKALVIREQVCPLSILVYCTAVANVNTVVKLFLNSSWVLNILTLRAVCVLWQNFTSHLAGRMFCKNEFDIYRPLHSIIYR